MCYYCNTCIFCTKTPLLKWAIYRNFITMTCRLILPCALWLARRLEANQMVFKAAKIVQKFNIEGSVNHVRANRFFNINIYIKFVPVHINFIIRKWSENSHLHFARCFPMPFILRKIKCHRQILWNRAA